MEPAGDLRERERLIGAVTDAVRNLDERHRSVILLRFYEGLKPREIATRLEIPVETVRTRTRRALATIASQLDTNSDGDRRAWALALFPLCQLEASAVNGAVRSSARIAAALVNGPSAKLLSGIAAAVVISLVVWVLYPDSPPDDVGAALPERASALGSLHVGDRERVADSSSSETPRTPASPPAPIREAESLLALPVEGVVIDALTDDPVPGARVRWVRSLGSRGATEVVASTLSGDAGRFRFPPHSAAVGGLALEVESEGYVPIVGTRAVPLELDSRPLVVRMSPGFLITGEVIYDSDGSPVEGGHGHLIARLQASAFAESPQGLRAARFMSRDLIPFQIDATGRFSVATLTPLLAVEVVGPGFAPAFSEPVRPQSGEDNHVVLRVHKGVSLKGVVRGSAGEPVAGARVSIYPAIEDRYPDHLFYNHHTRPEATTDETGSFEISNASRLYRSIEVTHPSWPLWAKHSELVPATELVEIELVPCTRLVGRLRPVASASTTSPDPATLFGKDAKGELRVEHERVSLELDADGTFRSAAISAGISRAQLHVDGWLDSDLDWSDSESREASAVTIDLGDVPLERGRHLLVVVLDAVSGEPLPGARVKLVSSGAETRRDPKIDERETDARGRASVSGFVTAELVLEVSRSGYAAARTPLPSDAATKTDDPLLEVALSPAGEIRGRVVDAAGRPLIGARVTVAPSSPVTWHSAQSSVDGRFRVAGIEAGAAFDLSVSVDGYLTDVRKIEALEAGETVELLPDIVLSGGGTIAGRVLDSAGRCVEGALVSALESSSTASGMPLGSWDETDAAGQFRIPGLASGDYYVSAAFRGRRVNETAKLEEAAGNPGSETDVTLRFDELGRGATLSATLLDPEGNPLRGASVSYAGARTVTDHEGRFTCFDLPAEGKLHFELERFLSREVRYASIGDLEPIVILDPGARLELRVKVSGDKRPRPSWLRVEIRSGQKKEGARSTTVSLDRLGVARLYAFEAGDWTVKAWSPDFPLPEAATVTLRGGETTALDVELDAR
jgi:hypothetical protein